MIPKPMATVLVVDPSPVVRLGIRGLVTDSISGGLVVDVSSAVEALTHLARRRFSLVILDVALPGRGGLEFVSDLHSAYQRVPILVFSALPEELYAYRALRAGASGYLHRSAPIEEVLRAIREVIAGRKYLGQAASAAIALELSSGCPPAHTALSNREFEVLRAIAAGSSLTETARKMSLSIKTIATHKRRLMRKLGVFNNAALIRFAVQAGMVAAETPPGAVEGKSIAAAPN